MTEKEKMLRGMLYLADDDPQLLSERMRAKDLCFALNHLPPSHREEREALLRKLLGGAGEQLDILSPSGATTAATSPWESGFSPTTGWSSWTVPR